MRQASSNCSMVHNNAIRLICIISLVELFDTHCHTQSAGLDVGERTTRELWSKSGDANPDEIIKRANDNGVHKMICVGCDLEDSKLAIDFVKNRPGLFASIGIHPHEAANFIGQNSLLGEFSALMKRAKVVAIGECGLDYFYEHSPKKAQIEILNFQLELAVKNDLPVIFHVREAFDDFWPIFDNYAGKIRGVLHSFTDSIENLDKALSQGLYIGVNGIATFTKNDEQRKMYRAIPSDNLLLETDAPFLTPNPYRGTVCEPYHVRTTCEFLARLRGETIEGVANASTANANRLFRVEDDKFEKGSTKRSQMDG